MMTQRIKQLGMIILLLAAFVLVMPGAVNAQGDGEDTPLTREVTDDEVNAVSSKLYCPVCENIPLDVCGTAACDRWREQVRTLLEDGATEDDVIDYFVEQFGDRVVGTPKNPTLNFLSWAVPALAVVLGLGTVAVVIVRWRSANGSIPSRDRDADDDTAPVEDDDYRARLERELRELQ
jgi:cytochrome c-type biogenesis protein CcmH